MSTGTVRTLAAHVGRRLRARGAARRRGDHAAQPPAPPAAVPYVPLPQAPRPAQAEQGSEPSADAAELDALRGALVHELDRLAEGDASSAGFRRA